MSAQEAPKSEQIQANVAAALSRLRGELGATSSPVAGTAQNPVPKSANEAGEATLGMPVVAPLPAGPVRNPEPMAAQTVAAASAGTGTRPFEPILGAVMGGGSTASNPAAAQPALEPANPEPASSEIGRPDLFATPRHEPVLKAERDPTASLNSEAQPDLLSGVEVPPAPPPPLGSFATEDEVGGRGKKMRNRLIALAVLVILVGGGAWAFLGRDRGAGGPVPVLTAETTPEKVKPADEGGMQVPNQNVQILDNMNGQAGNAQGGENVLPPPEQPVAPPAPDDTAPAVSEGAPAASASGTQNNAPAAVDQAAPAPAVPSVAAPAIPSVSAPEPGQTASSTPAPAAPEPTAAPVAQQAAPEPSAPAAAPAKPADATAAASAAQPKAAEPAKPATQTAAAATAPAPTAAATAGGIRVQLAAVKSEAAAKAQWAKLQKTYPDLLGALSLNVQSVVKDGVTYYRIQAGPLDSKAAAKTLCSKLAAQKQACIVAK
jgi:hypothetical protein